MEIEFTRLPRISPAAIIALMNSPSVRKHMPLSTGTFDESECAAFVAAKEQVWAEHGYGPWAFRTAETFLGWGGPQPEGDDVDIALVLGREAWGLGRRLHDEVVTRTFAEVGCASVTVLLPSSRPPTHALHRLGYAADGETEIDGHRFLRYRLRA
ncbi:GNAT family N-acetyltransferase [Actinokineospora sp. NBRC 105648]|uniref:GNAT family N-acetyltransferase n=1 Tax=Actinokineospora sp. NBRC 105648 TaxID=3032206 RepID=UPI0024A46DC8|nr:GNAT family N-acetyltransferase [Actinokineospora sp. NBRC 105648]GLZ37637.1 hypothetical protein Acsp05_12620 [Actinokineospora sp. NBRC 105648]